jgi:hypothetical protein
LGNLTGKYCWEYPDVDRRIILEWILGKQWEGVDWIHLAHDRDQWWALMNTVMILRVPLKEGNF